MKKAGYLLTTTMLFLAISLGACTADEIKAETLQNEETLNPAANNVSSEELYCLAQNIYFESRGESTEGQIAVAHTTLNRVAHRKFPNTICKVVWQTKQFSWTHDGLSDRPRNKKAWKKAQRIAKDVVNGTIKDNTNGALFFHSTHVKPYWVKYMGSKIKIDKHIFYEWNGKW